ncbi:MAG: tRNA lysidine(34) synthetase TilS [Desulfobacteraceae bacterium]|nr:tRNA lysidine(34) synthetase TilS [Desulfobacteraceae bacterium]
MKKNEQNNSKVYKTFVNKADNTVVRFAMLEKEDRVLAGVSGGPDSVALLLFLFEIKTKYSLEIGIAHLNHMLRGKEADRDEEFVRNLAEKLNIPYFIEKKDVATFAKNNRLSIEDSARKVRYSFLKDILRENEYSKIVLGHNRDDNAELILMNILRGSGPTGLTGIPPTRENMIIRPLIEISKQQIINFLESIDQTYMIDSSNNDDVYLRNSIRNYFIPLIEEKYNPKIKESLIRLSTIIKDEDDWMEKETEFVFNKALMSLAPDSLTKDTVELSIDTMAECHSALRKRIIRKAIKIINGNLKKISLKHVDDAVKLLLSTTPGESIDLPDQIRVFKEERSLFFKKESVSLRELGKKRKIERKRKNILR